MLQRDAGVGESLVAPHIVDEPVRRHGLPSGNEQAGQQGSLFTARQRNGFAVALDAERALHFESHDIRLYP